MQNACRNYLSYPLIVSCYNVYVFQTVKQSITDNQSYKQYSNATGRDNQNESSIAPPNKFGGGIINASHQNLLNWNQYLIVLSWGLMTHQPLRVILCRLPEKGRKEIEEIVEEMKERDREEKGTGMKVKKQKK